MIKLGHKVISLLLLYMGTAVGVRGSRSLTGCWQYNPAIMV